MKYSKNKIFSLSTETGVSPNKIIALMNKVRVKVKYKRNRCFISVQYWLKKQDSIYCYWGIRALSCLE